MIFLFGISGLKSKNQLIDKRNLIRKPSFPVIYSVKEESDMTENMKKFLEFAAGNPEVKEKAKTRQAEGEEAVKAVTVSLAKEYGFDLTDNDFKIPEGELSEQELQDIAGGGQGPHTGGCYCVLAGGGGGTQTDGDIYGCACAGYGQGGDGSADDFTCYCVGYGEGNVDEPINTLI